MVDASIMPVVPSSNTDAPSIMVRRRLRTSSSAECVTVTPTFLEPQASVLTWGSSVVRMIPSSKSPFAGRLAVGSYGRDGSGCRRYRWAIVTS